MWWNKREDKLRDDLINTLKEELNLAHKRHATDCERVDRLVEALARKANIDLTMPMPIPPPPIERIHIPNPWKDPNLVSVNFNQEKKQ